MGLIASRFSARKNEMSTFPEVSPEFANATSRPSIAREIAFDGLRPRRAIYITPYALGGMSSSAALQEEGTAFSRDADGITELGGDLKYSLTENLTQDVTANTDFAQVEADDEQIKEAIRGFVYDVKSGRLVEVDATC